MNLTLHVWRQAGPDAPGKMVKYDAADISPDMSFLEMLDVVNERLTERGEVPTPATASERSRLFRLAGVRCLSAAC